MRKLFLTVGIILLVLGLSLHGNFSISDSTYLDSFSTQEPCKIYLSKITLSEFSENNCPSQIILIQASFVKLFLGLGVLLIIGALFLIYSNKEKNKKL